jgi:hypothetical protein
MGLASIGFSDGVSTTLRIDPDSLDYKVTVNTNVEQTVAGRVIQITGSSITDVTMTGSIGEDHSRGRATGGATEHPGVSWKLAEEFFTRIQAMMLHQSVDSSVVGSSTKRIGPATFVYSPLGLRFQCYIKSIIDPDGDGQAGVVHKVGRANYRYTLSLFPVLKGSTDLLQAGQSAPNGPLDKAKAAAIDAYINRISAGIGWRFTQYNGGATASVPWKK